jgi:DNA-directed RNA polymerase subunit RPC12/RpoP
MSGKSNPGVPDRDKICSISESKDGHRMEYLRGMVKNSEYVCSSCGRSASAEEAVCSPENIKDRSDVEASANEKACCINDYDSSLRMEILKSLAENAEYVCSACGRASSVKEGICSPEKL